MPIDIVKVGWSRGSNQSGVTLVRQNWPSYMVCVGQSKCRSCKVKAKIKRLRSKPL